MAVGDAYRAFGVEPSPNYVEACRTLAAALIECEPYERPKKPSGAMRDMAFRGPFVVVDPESGVKRGRLLREHHDKERHMREAAGARLCTKEELEGNCTRGTGCGHDGELIWSSTMQP